MSLPCPPGRICLCFPQMPGCPGHREWEEVGAPQARRLVLVGEGPQTSEA